VGKAGFAAEGVTQVGFEENIGSHFHRSNGKPAIKSKDCSKFPTSNIKMSSRKGGNINQLFRRTVFKAKKRSCLIFYVASKKWFRRLWKIERKCVLQLRELKPCTCTFPENKFCCMVCPTLPSGNEMVISVLERALEDIALVVSSWDEYFHGPDGHPHDWGENNYVHSIPGYVDEVVIE
jgi:hypothetical protein